MKTNDMTNGNAIKTIFYFAIPLLVGNVFQQIYTIVDTMIAGYYLGDSAIAAIGATSSLCSMAIDLAIGMNSGYGIVAARYFGAKDQDSLKRSIASMLVLNLIMAIVLTGISIIFLKSWLHMLNVPEHIFKAAYSYIIIIFGGILSTIIYNMCAEIFRAVGNSKTPLYFLIFSCGMNLGLDLLFIIVFKWGVQGAAFATVFAQTISAVMAFYYIVKKYVDILPGREHFHFSCGFLWEIITTGLSMGMMLCVIDLGSIIYQRAINHLGEILIIAHTASRRIIGIFMMPLSSIATANAIFASQNYGAGKYKRVKDTLQRVVMIEIAWGVFACIFVIFFAEQLVMLLTNTKDTGVITNAVLSMKIHFLLYPVLGIVIVLRTTLQALREKIVPLVSSGFEVVIKVITGIWLIPAFGYICVCLAEPFIWLVSSVFLGIVFMIKKPISRSDV